MPAKGTSRFVVTPQVLARVEALARKGLTMEQIADCLGIVVSTLYKHKSTNVEFADAIRKGQSKGISAVANALFQSAKLGNVTAQIFFLKNRAPDEWKDRSVLEQTHRHVKEVQITEDMSPQDAASAYADTLRQANGGNVVPIKRAK